MRNRKRSVRGFSRGVILVVMIFSCSLISRAQGRFLRGEEYGEYSVPGSEADFYVSTSGNDSWSGKLASPNEDGTDGPFATIERAKEAVRELKSVVYSVKEPPIDKRFKGSPHKYGKGKDILVLIREGIYTLDKTLEFTPLDGGERVETDLPTGAFEYHKLKDYYVTYAAYPGEKPVISGGQLITGWKKGKKNRWSVKLDSEINELFANGTRQTLARTPDSGTFSMAEQPTDPSFFRFHPGDLKNWKGMEDNKITITVRWGKYHGQIAEIDEKKGIARLNPPSEDMLFVPPQYYVENVEALLDSPGEWFYDKKSSTLSYIPEEGIKNPNEASVTFPVVSTLVHVSGSREEPVRNLRFCDLAFTTTKPGGNATLFFEYSKNSEVLKNEIKNVSQTAISMGPGCYNNLISGNIIKDITGVGIRVAGNPRPENWNDVVSDNVVRYNKVTDCRPARVGIATANAMRTTISHNYVSNTGSYGITVGSWPNVEETCDGNHTVEYNHVSFTNMVRDDEGGIAVYGLNAGSVVRNNVVHDVHPASTNENVGFFFQNMSKGWTVTDNIFYNLKQGEVKYCAAYAVDNVYRDNFLIETPLATPERIINENPEFVCSDLKVNAENGFETGKTVTVSSNVKNIGGSGSKNVHLYVDGKVVETQKFPVLSGNSRTIRFEYQFYEPGKHTVAIDDTPYKEISVSGQPLYLLYSDLQTPIYAVPQGMEVPVSVLVKNVRPAKASHNISLKVDNKIVSSKEIELQGGETREVEFILSAGAGSHSVTIGDHQPINIRVWKPSEVTVENAGFSTYCSGTAKPCEFEYDAGKNHFEITACGTDFLHAEDSYGAIYLEKAISGNFVATVKVTGFGEGVSEWMRAGIFVRNDISKSNETEKGSLGSFLMFSTPKRAGAQWDEFGDGNMHNTKSRNYNVEDPFPVWLKIVRHGNKFTGYYSLDGKEWVLSRESGDIPGLADKMDIGLAGGTNDQKPSKVVFEDFELSVERK